MGFFGSLMSIGRRVLGGVGQVARKVAHFGAPIVRKVGELAVPAGMVASGLASAMGHPETARKILGTSLVAHHAAPQVGQVLEQVGAWGDRAVRASGTDKGE